MTQVPRATLLEQLATVASEAPAGYVPLQATPYRGHHLLAEALLDRIPDSATVFEAGVSSGYFARVLTSNGHTVDGFDIDPEMAKTARSVCREVWVGDLGRVDVDELLEDGAYDAVVFGDTLEHLPDPAAVLAALRPKLRPGGWLVVSVPNVANWAIRLQLLAGRFTYRDRGILDRTHLRFYTRRSLVDLIASSGYTVDSVTPSVPVPGLHGERGCRLAHRVGTLVPGLFAYTFIVAAQRS